MRTGAGPPAPAVIAAAPPCWALPCLSSPSQAALTAPCLLPPPEPRRAAGCAWGIQGKPLLPLAGGPFLHQQPAAGAAAGGAGGRRMTAGRSGATPSCGARRNEAAPCPVLGAVPPRLPAQPAQPWLRPAAATGGAPQQPRQRRLQQAGWAAPPVGHRAAARLAVQ
jgi:hypothetical protein